MKVDGTFLVDVAIDQGDGIIHYCVINMPGACTRTPTQGLTNAILLYALKFANQGWKKVSKEDKHLMMGLNVL